MTDIVEQAARVIYDTENYNRAVLEDAQVIAQALADAGLLRDTARTVPTREEIGEVVCAKSHYDGNCGCGRDDRTADAILALLADQPTVNEAKAQALEEFAAHIENTAQRDDVRLTEHAVNDAGGAYLAREQAQQIRDGK